MVKSLAPGKNNATGWLFSSPGLGIASFVHVRRRTEGTDSGTQSLGIQSLETRLLGIQFGSESSRPAALQQLTVHLNAFSG